MTAPTPPIIECRNVDGIVTCRSTFDSTQYGYKLATPGQYGMDVALGEFGVDEKRMALRFQFANGNRRDSVGDLLEIGGIDTSRHRSNPICLLDHAKTVSLPLGMAEDPETKRYTVELDPVAKQAWLTCFFYRGKGLPNAKPHEDYDHAVLCEQVFDMAVKRFLRAGSIGYQVLRAARLPANYETGTPQGLHLLNTLMLEGSLVVLPANADTVRKALDMPTCCGKPLSPVLVKSLSPYAPERKAVLGWEAKSCGCSDGKCHCTPAGETTMQAAGEGEKAAPRTNYKALRAKYRKGYEPYATEYAGSGIGVRRGDAVRVVSGTFRGNEGVINFVNGSVSQVNWTQGTGAQGALTSWIQNEHLEKKSLDRGSGVKALRAKYRQKGLPCSVGEYRRLYDSLSNAFSSLQSVGTPEEWEREADRVKRAASALMNAECTRAQPDDRDMAESLIDRTAAYIGNRRGVPSPRRQKSLSVKPRAKLIKGYTDFDIAFDTSHMTSAKQMDFHKAMEAEGFGKPVGGKWGEDGKTLLTPLKKSRFKACLEPGASPEGMLAKAAGIAQQHGAKLLTTVK